MFFRRPRVKEPTFEERLNKVRQAGFTVDSEPGTRIVRIRRDGCAVKIDLKDGSPCVVEPAGVLVCDEIGALTDSGFQKFFLTPSGDRRPALASELKTLHDFQEDLREALGQTSL